MDMIVCVKQIPDPEAPPASFKVDPSTNKVVPPPGVPPVISPYDENAVEAALKIKDAQGGKITVLSLGNNLVRDVVKKPIAMGCDELVLLEDEAFENSDSWSTANALAAAIKKIGMPDIIFCGRVAGDWDAGQVGPGLAELLDIPSVTIVKKVEAADGKVKVERLVSDGFEVLESSMPCLITVTSELGEPRFAPLKGIMAAAKKQPTIMKPADLGLDASQVGAAGRASKLDKLFQPVKEAKCEIVEGETAEEAAANLAVKLREAKVL